MAHIMSSPAWQRSPLLRRLLHPQSLQSDDTAEAAAELQLQACQGQWSIRSRQSLLLDRIRHAPVVLLTAVHPVIVADGCDSARGAEAEAWCLLLVSLRLNLQQA